MLVINACCYTYLYIGSAKVQQNSNFTKRKSDFFSSPSYFIPSLFLLYSFFIATLFPTAEHRPIS